MARPSKGAIADSGAATVAKITVTYTTDDPGTVPDSAITIADGDAVAGLAEVTDEFEAKINAILDVLADYGMVQPY